MTSDPIPEEELPSRKRLESFATGPESEVLNPIPPQPVAPPANADVERLEALKRSLGEEIPPASPPPESPYRSEDEPETGAGGPSADPPPVGEEQFEELTKREKRKQKRKNRSFWQELPILILVALIVAIVIKTFFFQAFYIPSGSMIPTLQINDRVLVNKLSYRFGAVERGDILVFDSPEAIDVDRSFPSRVARSIGEATGLTSPDTVLIKRVIGLPGETVAVRDNQVYVNGNPIAEPYLPDGIAMRDFDELVIPADHVFMMGDNRNQSRDSRVFGPIPRADIVGRAFVTVWPPGAWGGL